MPIAEEPPWRRNRDLEPPLRIAIVGGGLAGLSAAAALAAAYPPPNGGGVIRRQSPSSSPAPQPPARSPIPAAQITLFESRRLTGGRAGSFVDPATGELVDYCQHVAMGCCTNLLDLLDDFQLLDDWRRVCRLDFLHPTAGVSRLAPCPFLPPPLQLFPSFWRLRYLSSRQRRQIARALWRLLRTPPASLRQLTAAAWLHQQRQSADSIRDFWEVILVSALGESSAVVSMAAAHKVLVDGFLGPARASEIWVPRRPLSELFGRRLPAQLQRRGVRVLTGTAVRQIDLSDAVDDRSVPPAGPLQLQLDDGTPPLTMDQVIVAVPGQHLHRILSPRLADQAGLDVQAWRQLPTTTISGVHLWFDRPITDYAQAALVGSTAQWIFRPDFSGSDFTGTPAGNTGTGNDARDRHYYQVVISGSQRLRGRRPQQIITEVLEDLCRVLPAARGARLLDSRLVSDPQSIYSITPAVDASRPPTATALPCLHLAGDFVQTGWPATMEGAVISGRQAAATAIQATSWGRAAGLTGTEPPA